MISAQSHLQPSNGNKLNILLVLLLLSGIACSASRTGTQLPNRHKPATEEEEVVPDKRKQEAETKKQKEAAAPEFDRDFHIALFLPFSLHKDILPSSKEYKVLDGVTDYYQGVLLALDHLKQEGIQVTLHVYDTRKDSSYTAGLLGKVDFELLDLVIGPLDHGAFEAVAVKCAAGEVPVVAPFALPGAETGSNAFAFYCAAPLEAYGMRVAEYLLREGKGKTILHLSDGSATDRAFINGFRRVPKSSGLTLIERKIEPGADYTSLLNRKDSAWNYVLIPSDNEKQANMALRSFRSAEEDGIPVQVFGMDSWLNFRDPETDHWEKLHATLVTSFFSSETDSAYRVFHNAFRQKFQVPPGDWALRGYDQMLFFGNALMAFGKFFPGYITGTAFRGVGSDYYWTKGSKVVENHALRLIRFSQYRFSVLP